MILVNDYRPFVPKICMNLKYQERVILIDQPDTQRAINNGYTPVKDIVKKNGYTPVKDIVKKND